MTPSELISEVKKLPFEEIRNNSANLFEMVIRTDRKKELDVVLGRYFGSALKSAGDPPNEQLSQRVAVHGGIRKEQTLYHLECEGVSGYAMLWPWANGILITVKIVHNAQKK